MFYVNADRSAIVPAGSAEAAFGVQPKDMKRLGYDKLPVLGEVEMHDMPDAEEPRVFTTANLVPVPEIPEPEEKEADKPADKAAKKPANKSKGSR